MKLHNISLEHQSPNSVQDKFDNAKDEIISEDSQKRD